MITIHLKIAAIIKKRILNEVYLEYTMIIHPTNKQSIEIFMTCTPTTNFLRNTFVDDVINVS